MNNSTRGVYTAAGDVARLIARHPGETARGLYRLYLDRFSEFGVDGTYASALIQQHLVKFEDGGLVRREKGAKKTDPHRWWWTGAAAAPTEPGTGSELESPTATDADSDEAPAPNAEPVPNEPFLVGEPRVGADAPLTDPLPQGWRALLDAPEPAAAQLPAQDDEPHCSIDILFSLAGSDMRFMHDGPWNERVALRLERFLLVCDQEVR